MSHGTGSHSISITQKQKRRLEGWAQPGNLFVMCMRARFVMSCGIGVNIYGRALSLFMFGPRRFPLYPHPAPQSFIQLQLALSVCAPLNPSVRFPIYLAACLAQFFQIIMSARECLSSNWRNLVSSSGQLCCQRDEGTGNDSRERWLTQQCDGKRQLENSVYCDYKTRLEQFVQVS